MLAAAKIKWTFKFMHQLLEMQLTLGIAQLNDKALSGLLVLSQRNDSLSVGAANMLIVNLRSIPLTQPIHALL